MLDYRKIVLYNIHIKRSVDIESALFLCPKIKLDKTSQTYKNAYNFAA